MFLNIMQITILQFAFLYESFLRMLSKAETAHALSALLARTIPVKFDQSLISEKCTHSQQAKTAVSEFTDSYTPHKTMVTMERAIMKLGQKLPASFEVRCFSQSVEQAVFYSLSIPSGKTPQCSRAIATNLKLDQSPCFSPVCQSLIFYPIIILFLPRSRTCASLFIVELQSLDDLL